MNKDGKNKALIDTIITIVLVLGLMSVLTTAFFLDSLFVVKTPELNQLNWSLHNKLVFEDSFRGTNATSNNTIAVFSDFSCTACKAFYPTLRELRLRHPEVNILFKHLPGSEGLSRYAAIAFECAKTEQKEFDIADELFFKEYSTKEDIDNILTSLNLNSPIFTECMSSETTKKLIQADEYQAAALNIRGTPTTFVNGIRIEGAIEYAALEELTQTNISKDTISFK